MAQWHLDELRAALQQRGWGIEQREGEGYRGAARWVLRRAGVRYGKAETRELVLEFGVHDARGVLPLDQAWSCAVPALGLDLYFTQPGLPHSESRLRWQARLGDFARALEAPRAQAA
jgi:hypothetical protein